MVLVHSPGQIWGGAGEISGWGSKREEADEDCLKTHPYTTSQRQAPVIGSDPGLLVWSEGLKQGIKT